MFSLFKELDLLAAAMPMEMDTILGFVSDERE
jgi:hypothetical protein